MTRTSILFVACGACTASDPPATTTPAQITITTSTLDGLSPRRVTYRHSAFALATNVGEMVVFTDEPPGTDCDAVTNITARWTLAGSTPSDLTWQLDLADGGGWHGSIATASSFDVDVIETEMSGHFAIAPSIVNDQQVIVSLAFGAPFCETQPASL